MSLPAGLPASTIVFDDYVNIAGRESWVGLKGRIIPVDPLTHQPITLLHAATNTVISADPEPIVLSASGTTLVGPIPRAGTGQLSPDNFRYAVVWDTSYPSKDSPGNRIFVLPADAPEQVPYNSLVPAVNFEPPVYLPPKGAVYSVNGQLGFVILSPADIGAQPVGDYATIAYVDSRDAALEPRLAATEANLAAATAAATINTLALRDANGGFAVAWLQVTSNPNNPTDATNKAYVDALGSTTNVPDTIARRDAAANLRVGVPVSAADATRKDYVDAIGSSPVVANTVVRRSAAGNFEVNTPTVATHPANKSYVDALGTATATNDTVVRRGPSGAFLASAIGLTLPPFGASDATRKDYVDSVTAITAAPDRIGRLAVVAGVGYIATGTASTADWKQIT